MITREALVAIMDAAEPMHVDLYLPHLTAAAAEFEINTPAREAAFLATLADETGQLSRMVENLNYSAEQLARTWPGRYACRDGQGVPSTPYRPNGLAEVLAHRPEAIANNVYADRMGNRGELSGDGWRHRGAGGIQETGRTNQLAVALKFGVPVETVGDWLRTPEGAMRSAAWGFQRRGCNELADAGDFDAVCDAINLGHHTARVGDAIGFDRRLAFFNAGLTALA